MSGAETGKHEHQKKMTVWYGILIAILLAGTVLIACIQVRKSVRASEQESLSDAAERIASEVKDPSTGKVKIAEGYKIGFGMAAVINTSNGKILADNTGMEWINQEPYHFNSYWTYQNGADEWMVYDLALVQDENRKINAIVRVCIPENRQAFQSVIFAMIAGSCMFLFIAILGGYLILSKALKPLEDMTATAGMIEKGNLKQRIALSGTEDEISALGRALNAMLDRLGEAIRRERQFASDASHELKTPVAVIMNAGEQLLRHADPSDQDTSENGQMIVQESRRMNKIISQLLVLTRGDAGKSHSQTEKINLNVLVQSVMENEQEQAEQTALSVQAGTVTKVELKSKNGITIFSDHSTER